MGTANGVSLARVDAPRKAAPAAGDKARLSPREIEVLRHLAGGKNNREIARELFISRQTIKKHVSSILAKIHADNRVQAAVYAVREGIV